MANNGVDILRELEPVAADLLIQHLRTAKDWVPDEYVPWGQGQNFALLGGKDWQESDSTLDPDARIAMELNLLTEENLPSYHHEIATRFGLDSAWGHWVGRWTAEEGRHAIVIHNYLVASRAVDPRKIERERLAQVTQGYSSGNKTTLQGMSYVTFQELATRISHRNTGKKAAESDPIADRLLQRVSADENLHMIFYRGLVAAALDRAPDLTMQAIRDEVVGFEMPGANMEDFKRRAAAIAVAGIYNLRIHYDDVVTPVLRFWNIFDRNDFGPKGEQAREELSEFLVGLDRQATLQSEVIERRRARQARVGKVAVKETES